MRPARCRPNTARVPNRVASTAEQKAMNALCPSASMMNGLPKARPNHCTEQHSKARPLRPALKLNSTIRAMGA
ncbi:hypothetical protein D3C78_1612770 [compost metagenome]